MRLGGDKKFDFSNGRVLHCRRYPEMNTMFAFRFFAVCALVVAVLANAAVCAAGGAGALKIDASTPQNLERSYAKIVAALDEDAQQRFALAMTTIAVALSQRPDLGGSEKIREIIDGKTPDEIIAEARKLTGFVRVSSLKINGGSAQKFSESAGRILVSLPPEKQPDFSDAVARLMYERENKKISEADFLKSVDGKTPDEIIDLARKVEVPFVVQKPTAAQKVDIEKISPADYEKYGIKREAAGGAVRGNSAGGAAASPSVPAFKNSLVPSAE